jgi:hypothetical protein
MKLQEQGLISLEWLDAAIEQMKREQRQELPCKATAIHILEQVKKQLISPIPLAEKIWDESKDNTLSFSPSRRMNKIEFLNSDIKLD